MPTFNYGGWSGGVTLANLKDEALAYANLDSTYNHLGDTTALRDQLFADFVNRAIEEILEANPALGQTTTPATISLEDGTKEYSAPSDLHGLAIVLVRFQDSGSDAAYDERQVFYANPALVQQLPVTWRNGEVKWEYPRYWYWGNHDRTKIAFAPVPSTAKTIEVIHRQENAVITEANINSPGAASIMEIPSRFQNVLALGVAKWLVEPTDLGRKRELFMEYAGELRKMQEALAKTPARYQAGQSRGWSNRVFNAHALFAMSPMRGGKRRYSR